MRHYWCVLRDTVLQQTLCSSCSYDLSNLFSSVFLSIRFWYYDGSNIFTTCFFLLIALSQSTLCFKCCRSSPLCGGGYVPDSCFPSKSYADVLSSDLTVFGGKEEEIQI